MRRVEGRVIAAGVAAVLTVSGAVVFFVLHRLGQTRYFEATSTEMSPTVSPGDRLVVNTNARHPRIGDIVVFACEPVGSSTGISVGRVLAAPGDTVECDGVTIVRNGVKVREGYIRENSRQLPMSLRHEMRLEKIRVPERSYYVVGDNRRKSFDSRYFGPIQQEQIVGCVTEIVRDQG